MFRWPRGRPTQRRLEENARDDYLEAILLAIGKGNARPTSEHQLVRLLDPARQTEAQKKFSSLGAAGAHPQNVERDLHRWTCNLYDLDIEPLPVKIPLLIDGQVQEVGVPVIGPHQWLKALSRPGREGVFRRTVFGPDGPDGLLEFWETMMENPYAHPHPGMNEDAFPDKMLPFVIHVDGAESFTAAEAIIVSLSIYVSSGHVLDVKLLSTLIMHHMVPTRAMRDEMFRRLCIFYAWSFHHSIKNVGPAVDMYRQDFAPDSINARMANQPLNSDGYCGCFVFWKGDRKARMECHRETRHHSCSFMCQYDYASQFFRKAPVEFSYANFFGPWRDTMLTPLEAKKQSASPFARIPGWHPYANLDDLLHNWHKGIGEIFGASLMVDFLLDGSLAMPRGADDALRDLYLECRAWCACNNLSPPRHPFSLKLLGLQYLGELKFPCFMGYVKAATVKVVMSFLAHKALEFTRAGTEHQMTRAMCAWAYNHWFAIIDSAHRVLTVEQAEESFKAGVLFYHSYARLNVEAVTVRDLMLYQIIPKHHYAWHQIEFLRINRMNPKHHHCFMDEDFVGRIANLASRTSSRTVITRCMQRYLLCMAIQWEVHRRNDAGDN